MEKNALGTWRQWDQAVIIEELIKVISRYRKVGGGEYTYWSELFPEFPGC